MFVGTAAKIGLRAKKGGACDYTPAAVNWTTGLSSAGVPTETNTQTITGITCNITLRTEYSTVSFSEGGVLRYKKNGGVAWTNVSPTATTSIQTFDLVMANNDTLQFQYEGGANSDTCNLTIKNQSDGAVTLDTVGILWTPII